MYPFSITLPSTQQHLVNPDQAWCLGCSWRYCLLSYLDLGERWKRLLAFWGRLPHSKLTLCNRQYWLLGYLDLGERWKRLLAFWGRLPHSKLTLHNRQYCLLGYLDLGERYKRLLAFWGRLPHSKLTLRNRRYCLLGDWFLEEFDSYENPSGEGYHTHLTLCTRQHCFPIHLSGPEWDC